MTVYLTPTELRVALSRDAQHPEGTAAEMSDAVLQLSIDAATAQIDARLYDRYITPFPDPPPPLVVSMTTAIAAWLADLGYRQSVDSNSQDPVAKRYQWANEMISRLTNGTAALPGVPTHAQMVVINPYEGQLFGLPEFDLVVDGGLHQWPGGDGRWPSYG